jgi:hypothetical protein
MSTGSTSNKMPCSRCNKCNKKLGLLAYKCRCGKELCVTHLPSEEHACEYNYKQQQKEDLRKALDTTDLHSKFEKI